MKTESRTEVTVDEQAAYYESVFAEHMAAFVRYKRAQGLGYTSVPIVLRALSRFLASSGQTELRIGQELIDQWCSRRQAERSATQRIRISYTRELLDYLAALGIPVAFPRPSTPLRGEAAFVPYIFTRSELDRLFIASDQLTGRKHTVMPSVMPVLLRLLYGCGLRVSEALNLTRSDVDLDAGCLTVRHAKLDQDRLVPLSSTLADIMRRYDATVPRLFVVEVDSFFFSHKDGRRVAPDTVYTWYRQALWAAGISHRGKGHGPRLHDLRHTFAVYSLKAMVDQGADVYWALPTLATYLGHATIDATGGYVRLTQDMFPEVTEAMGAIAAHVVPGIVA